MSNFIYHQFYVFLATFYGGIIIALIYDFYKVFRRIMNPSKIATIIQDLLFWIIVTAVAISVLLYSNDGNLRGYTALGFLIGVWIYNMLLSDVVVKMLLKTFMEIRKAFSFLSQHIILPFKSYTSKTISKSYNKGTRLLKPYYIRTKRMSTIPKRIAFDIKKYTRLIIRKKKKDI